MESINLQGNPICKHPNYQAVVLNTFENLKLFDGKVSLIFFKKSYGYTNNNLGNNIRRENERLSHYIEIK
jgi:hypothetical protein